MLRNGPTRLPKVYRTDNPALDGLIRPFHTDSDETFASAATSFRISEKALATLDEDNSLCPHSTLIGYNSMDEEEPEQPGNRDIRFPWAVSNVAVRSFISSLLPAAPLYTPSSEFQQGFYSHSGLPPDSLLEIPAPKHFSSSDTAVH